MATEICPNEGKHWIETNALSGSSLHALLLYGVTIAGSDIDATTSLATLQTTAEVDGTSYARVPVSLGTADANGIIPIPEVVFDTGTDTDWESDCQAWGLATHATAGTAVYYWDLSATRNMAAAHTLITIPTLDIFLLNPGE